LWLAGAGKKPIAAQLGLDVKTVRRYLRAAEECGLTAGQQFITDDDVARVVAALRSLVERAHGDSWELCERERAFIAQHLAQHLKLSKVQRLLGRRGVAVPYPTLHRFAVAELGFGRTTTTVPVADCEAGEEVQLDTGWMTLLEPDLFGTRRRFRAWIFTAVRSRHRYVHASHRRRFLPRHHGHAGEPRCLRDPHRATPIRIDDRHFQPRPRRVARHLR
jgi:transposase